MPWLLYYGILGFEKFCTWIDPMVSRLLHRPAPDKSLFVDLAKLVPFPPEAIAKLQSISAEKEENYFLDVLERRKLGGITDLRDFPEDIIAVLRPCARNPVRTSWNSIETEVRSLDPAPVEEVLRVIYGHLKDEESIPRMFATGHDYYVTAFVARANVSSFDQRVAESTDADLEPFCIDEKASAAGM